jgi:hypothetical protein
LLWHGYSPGFPHLPGICDKQHFLVPYRYIRKPATGT